MGCYIWYREEGTGRGRSPPRPILAVPNITARTSTASVPINVLLYNGLRCSCFKGRISSRVAHLVFDDTIVVYLCIRQRHGAWRDWGARLAVSRRLCDGSGGTGNVEVETRVVGAAATSRLADDVVDGRDELVERWTNTRLVVPTKTHYAEPVPPPTSRTVFRVDKAKYRKVNVDLPHQREHASNVLPLPARRRWSPLSSPSARHQRTLQDHGYGLVYRALCLFTPRLSLSCRRDNNNIYFAKGQVHQKIKSSSKLATILTATKIIKQNKNKKVKTTRGCTILRVVVISHI